MHVYFTAAPNRLAHCAADAQHPCALTLAATPDHPVNTEFRRQHRRAAKRLARQTTIQETAR